MTKFERARERLRDAARDFARMHIAASFGAIVPEDERSRRRLERAAVAFAEARAEAGVRRYGRQARVEKPPRLTQRKVKELLAPKHCACKEPKPPVESVQHPATRRWIRQCSGCGYPRQPR